MHPLIVEKLNPLHDKLRRPAKDGNPATQKFEPIRFRWLLSQTILVGCFLLIAFAHAFHLHAQRNSFYESITASVIDSQSALGSFRGQSERRALLVEGLDSSQAYVALPALSLLSPDLRMP